MIQPFYGEFLMSPVPLEMDLGRCSHSCAFCYANLGNPDREANVPALSRLLATYRERRLRARGHRTVAAINPLVPEWLPLPDAERLVAELEGAGVEGVSVELLHLSTDHRANMTERERAAVSLPVLDRTRARRLDPGDVAHLHAVRKLVLDVGIPLFTSNQPEASDYFRPYRETYPSLLPCVQDAVDWCHAKLEDGDVLDFQGFLRALTWRYPLPPQTSKVDSYVRAKSRGGRLLAELLASGLVRAGMTWEEVVRVFYAEPRIRTSPSRWLCFAYLGERTAAGWVRLVDGEGLPYLVFKKGGTQEYYAEAA